MIREFLKNRLYGLALWRWMPRERRILQLIRAFTNVTTFLAAYAGFLCAETVLKLPHWVSLLGVGGVVSILWAIFSADFIENRLRRAIFGVSYNPNMWAMQEWEGGMFPTQREYEAQWREEINKIRAPWWGEKLGGE